MSTRIPNSPTAERTAPEWSRWAPQTLSLAPPAGRGSGEIVTERRSSWVRRADTPAGALYVKTYDYPSWRARLRDFGKRTAPWGRPRAVAEFDALAWLRAHGEAAPEPLAALVWRRLGFVTRATLVTAAFPGIAADALLPTLPTVERTAAAAAIGAFVHRVHALGFRDRNLDLRNLLLARADHGATWTVAKIDSPRFVLRRPGPPRDALAAADWRRLLPQLDAWQLAAIARDAGGPGNPAAR